MEGALFDGITAQKPSPLGIRDAWNTAYGVNVTGTQVMAHVSVPLLLKSKDPRLLFVISGLSSLANCSTGRVPVSQKGGVSVGWPKPPEPSVITYRASKAALNMLMLDWVRLKVWAISPGFLTTGLGGVGAETMKEHGAGDPAFAGRFIKDVAEGVRDEDVGKVINRDGVDAW
ncbi:hypothetical protein K469DRAFT_714443 [Zopfia rhizophila CBS 207.26]|uniref:NAD(P)-binding protein n=1 Tax=Zopfia rhizophila CBS 207.26 TaxID=1314779 RepID=A0A6A6DLY4_9PEZI|nr:hypothetical protein K469DRAFT_714443 [Zopfia rhizophila CBS 207.26]